MLHQQTLRIEYNPYQGFPNLNPERVFAGADKGFDLEMLLDGLEKDSVCQFRLNLAYSFDSLRKQVDALIKDVPLYSHFVLFPEGFTAGLLAALPPSEMSNPSDIVKTCEYTDEFRGYFFSIWHCRVTGTDWVRSIISLLSPLPIDRASRIKNPVPWSAARSWHAAP